MKKKILAIATLLLALVACLGTLSACFETQSDKEYWFSETSKQFVAYDSNVNTIDNAGTYWYFTSKYEGDVTIKISIDVNDTLFTTSPSYAYMYVNDIQVKSESDTEVYTYIYKVSLKKGDKLKLHATWVYGISADDKGFTISYFIMNDGTADYLVEGIS
jgi:hypothetical protein